MNNDKMHWTAVWGNAISIAENRPEGYAKNITLRYPIYVPFGGDAIRFTFDNYCGTEPITIEKTTIRVGCIFHTVTFENNERVTIENGKNAVCDPVFCDIAPNSTVEISFYLKDFTQMRSAVATQGPLSKGDYALGDLVNADVFPKEITKAVSCCYFLSNVSVHTEEKNRAVVCYGDSITAQSFPEELALYCKDNGIDDVAIVRKAVSGSRILREYTCISYESYGLCGEKRFSHEVPADGADTVFILHGINDMIHPVGTDVNPFRPMSDLPTAEELIDGLKEYIAKARSFGYKVYVGTLLPIKGWRTYAPFRNEIRNAYNAWIRSTDLIDGYVDLDAALCDPDDKDALLPAYDSGDHLHPSSEGARAMARETAKVLFGR